MTGRYELLRMVGRGAAGEVHLARDLLLGGRLVALKRIRAKLDDHLREAFEREFATMAALSLPGVARVFDFGIDRTEGQEQGPYYTRAFVEGEPLDVACGGLAPGERVERVARVARVVDQLHRAGVVHGDIKPGNLILDAAGHAHVIDFGLSRVLGPGGPRGATGGTPPFMAPELVQGEPMSVASDVYALGVTLWLVLTGGYPHGDDARQSLRRKLEGEQPGIPEGADPVARRGLEVALRAFATDPRDRFPSVDEMNAALSDLIPGAEPAARVFVPPPPVGHDEVIGRLQGKVLSSSGEARALVVGAPPGGGKSRLLQELKWRLQIRGAQVLEARVRGTGVRAPLVSLLRQAAAFADRPSGAEPLEAVAERLRTRPVSEGEASNALAAAFEPLLAHGPVAVLVDDLDRAEAMFGAILRSAIHASTGRGVAVVATAARGDSAAVRALGAEGEIRLQQLSPRHVHALATQSLGPLDASVLDALVEHCEGLPGPLVDALAALFGLAGATAADVRALEPGQARRAAAAARLGACSPAGRSLLAMLAALDGSSPLGQLEGALEAVGIGADDLVAALAESEGLGLIVRSPEGVALAEPALGHALLERQDKGGAVAMARRLLEAEEAMAALAPDRRARLAVLAADAPRILELCPAVVEDLSARGEHAAAARLAEAVVTRAEGPVARAARLALARCKHALGEHAAASDLAQEVMADADDDGQRADAAIVAARALTALGDFDRAVEALSRVPEDADSAARARVARDLAKVHLRRGDYAATTAAAEAGLAAADPDDPARCELLCSSGMAAIFRSDHEEARRLHEEALAVARRVGTREEQSIALAYLGIGHWRAGDLPGARDLLSQGLELAREGGDVGNMANYSMNLGAVLFCLGEPQSAAEHYAAASKLARRAGRRSTEAQARANLAHVHIYFGLYERARAEVAEVLSYARHAGQPYIEAQAKVFEGDLAARAGDVETALVRYNDALAQYAKLGQSREVAEHNLDLAELLLDRAGPADVSAAAARLSAARETIEGQGLRDLQLRLDLLLSRARVGAGDGEGALPVLEDVLSRARTNHDRDVEWSALSAIGVAHEALGADFAARRSHRMAAEVLEDIALKVPREHREAFWQDPRRRAVRERALAAEDSSGSGGMPPSDLTMLIRDPRAERLLEIIKRLAAEHDLDRLLERITESAVDLSGAERGFVLLTDGEGNLEKRASSTRKGDGDPHEAFSYSIAEAVLIDGEPIVTVDATHDGRLSEYVSVHKLMLRSVACLPIRGHSGTVGVLYLEHRRSRGRFSDSAVDLLFAFADQAAIALENARLLEDNRLRREELERANAALAHAKDDLEELLHARSEELAEAKRELTRARNDRRPTRHGMVGQSPPMLRLYDQIDRLQHAIVPVVICGESGTGKELVARAIHYGGPRAKAPFVALNCGSVPETLLESELFGHVKGAFSGADRDRRGMIARASGGTLFLDEVGDMPAKMQVDLLRVLQEGTVCRVGADVDEPVDVRFVAASQVPLERLVEQGRFREDLFYRLNVVQLALPPLRERKGDLPLLAAHFLRMFAERDGRANKRMSREAIERLAGHPLPGNVRQLEHVLLQAWVMVEGHVIEAGDLSLDGASVPPPSSMIVPLQVDPLEPVASLDDHRRDEKRRILEALEHHGWNRARAAKSLGIARRTFYRRLQEYEIL